MIDKLRLSWLASALLAAFLLGPAVPASGAEPPQANVVTAPSFEDALDTERLRQRLQKAIDDFEQSANAALEEEVPRPGDGDGLCTDIAAQWDQGTLTGRVDADDNLENGEDSEAGDDSESGDFLVLSLSILKGPWAPPGPEDGQDLFFVFRIDSKGRWVPTAVCIRAGPTILTMKPERTQYGVVPKL